VQRQFSDIRISAVAAAGPGAGSQAPDAAAASGIATLREQDALSPVRVHQPRL